MKALGLPELQGLEAYWQQLSTYTIGDLMDPVSFLFSQILTQVDYLFENGHLGQAAYSVVVEALLQDSSQGPSSSKALDTLAALSRRAPDMRPTEVLAPVEAPVMPLATPPTGTSTSANADSPPSARAKSVKPSFLKLKGSTRRTNSTGTTNIQSASQSAFREADEPDLGKVNQRARSMLGGGWILGQVVDQALALTPGVPEGLRESIVEKVEEGSREYVNKATDPRNQQAWRENALRMGNSAVKIARGGGGTSRASSSQLPTVTDGPSRSLSDETGEYSIVASTPMDESGAYTVSSVHSFVADPELNITTVVTASFRPQISTEISTTHISQSKSSSAISSRVEVGSESGSPSSAQRQRSYSRTPRDPTFVTGHDW